MAGVSAVRVRAVSARTANGLAILLGNALMLPYVTIVVSQGILPQSELTKSLCWNCREPGHMAGNCPNEGICHTCGKAGHRARDCTAPPLPPGDLKLKTGHLLPDCQNDPVCNLCNISGHLARDCPKAGALEERGGGARPMGGGGGYRDIVCRNCQQVGHMSRDCMALMICHNCGGRGHLAYECPSGRFMDRFPRSPGFKLFLVVFGDKQ
ncbi:hypothetical protein HAX54_016850 [Datura stramonium]|uniref:CCHC-type domain-containing protein n=1 Tax=Datura stramonium TaxID=4076 RepID=A0ABS8UJP9_DATST|nr:hypothetical protein [Datura stramonium]